MHKYHSAILGSRKRFVVVVGTIVFSLFFSSQYVFAQEIGFRFKLSGGFETLGIGDPNTLLDSSRSFLENIGRVEDEVFGNPTEVVGEMNKAGKAGIGLGGEAIITFSRFGFGLGLEHLGTRSVMSDTTLKLLDDPEELVLSRIDGQFSALALTANVYVFFGRSPLEFYAFTGPGLYFGKATWDYLFNDLRIIFGGYFEDQSIDAKAHGLGFQGGLGLDYELTPRVGFFAEGKVRACKLNDWTGDEVWETTLGGPFTWSGKLWFYEFYDFMYGTDGWYPYTDTFEEGNEPSGDYARNGRPFEIDLTGVSLRVGIIVRF